MPLPRKRWPGHRRSMPVGRERSRTPARAQQRHLPSRSRRQWARAILDFLAEQWPGRPLRSVADGGYAPKDDVRQFPTAVQVLGRFPRSAPLSTWPPKPTQKPRGAPRTKGARIGSPQTVAQPSKGGSPPPDEEGAEGQAWGGLWHAGWPGRLLQVGVVRRDATRGRQQPGQSKPPPPVEAFFPTDRSLTAQAILHEYGDRWAVEIAIRDANACAGLGQDQCRKRPCILGANTCRVVLAAARTLWCIDQVEGGTGVTLCRYRPWYRPKVAPSPLDVVWACREALHEAGIFPLPRFSPDLAENHEEPEHAFPLAA